MTRSKPTPPNYYKPMMPGVVKNFGSMTVPELRAEIVEKCSKTNTPKPPKLNSMKKAKLLEELSFSEPHLGRHESYTVRALNLTLLEVEDAPVKGDGNEKVEGEVIVEKIEANSTMMERVSDFTKLRRGDHVCVGLNPLRKIVTAFDKMLQYMAHFEILNAYHHFIMYDDVHHLSKDGIPMTMDDKPAMICEYSNTPGGAMEQAWKYGLKSVWDSPAPWMRIPFYDYVEGCSTDSAGKGIGIYRIKEDLDETDRDTIVKNMDALLASHETYSFIYRNCEHAAFAFNPKRPVWVSPQVPYLFWNLFRVLINSGSIYFLLNNPIPDPRNSTTSSIHIYHIFCLLYHSLSTFPVAMQSVVQLVRTVMSLTAKKERNDLSKPVFYHLIYKEFMRACLGGGLACLCLGLLPKMVRDTDQKSLAAALVLLAYTISNGLFNLSCFVTIRAMLYANGGVAVPMVGKKGRKFGRGRGEEGEKQNTRSSSRSRGRSTSKGRKNK
ncbi:hypothetical protein TL16_g12857 [Triparma laevis f. inornata]|uniref:LRAT domain-containing protein n=1 Tax=Triparma laevis f. inornata TaxID=1714386 RepID=A0A9W7BP90_9STRA|nr:hypothetical protein TL16_g12857 [Triparma laevis f. inornata]